MAKTKKSIADMAGAAVDEVLGVNDTKDVQSTYKTQETQKEYERLNLRIPKHIKDYLYNASWNESTPTRRVSVTAYIIELVEKDMREHGLNNGR